MRRLVVVALAAAASGTALASTELPVHHATYAVSAVFDGTEFRNGCDVDCYIPHTCDWCEHKAPAVASGEGSHLAEGGGHTYCVEGQCHFDSDACISKHAICIGGGTLENVLAYLDDGDYAAVAALIDAEAGLAAEWKEGLIALRSCSGKVVGTVALAPAELGVLAAALN
jgi:hypothetical protein